MAEMRVGEFANSTNFGPIRIVPWISNRKKETYEWKFEIEPITNILDWIIC